MRFMSVLGKALLLAGLAYLGLYVYGLVMGAFSPGELVGFTALALGVIAAYAIHLIRLRRVATDPDAMREMYRQRERRGF